MSGREPCRGADSCPRRDKERNAGKCSEAWAELGLRGLTVMSAGLGNLPERSGLLQLFSASVGGFNRRCRRPEPPVEHTQAYRNSA